MLTMQQNQLQCELRFAFCQVAKLCPHQVIVKMYYLVKHMYKKGEDTKNFKSNFIFPTSV